MKERESIVQLQVGTRRIAGTLISPVPTLEGMLFIHGCAGNQEQYLERARQIAGLGCVYDRRTRSVEPDWGGGPAAHLEEARTQLAAGDRI
jgi:hypothetical protein